METVVFICVAACLLVMAMAVATARNPMHGALALIVALGCLAVLYVLLEAPFVAAMQVLVYAGAIMVLFLFVIMLLNLGPDAMRRPAYLAVSKVLGGVAMVYVTVRVLSMTLTKGGAAGRVVDGSVRHVGNLLLSDFLFNFEAISVLLLTAVVGAVVLGLKRLT